MQKNIKNEKIYSINKQIGERIYILRKIRRIPLRELSKLIGVSFQQIQKYESGKDKISAARLLLIAEALNVDIDKMFYISKEEMEALKENKRKKLSNFI